MSSWWEYCANCGEHDKGSKHQTHYTAMGEECTAYSCQPKSKAERAMTRAIQFAVEGPEPNKWNTRFPLDGEDKPKSVPSRAPAGVTTQEHYASLTPEPIDVIEGWNLSYCPANAIKYIARAGKKCESGTPTEAAIRDYRKAISYLQRAVNALEGKSGW